MLLCNLYVDTTLHSFAKLEWNDSPSFIPYSSRILKVSCMVSRRGVWGRRRILLTGFVWAALYVTSACSCIKFTLAVSTPLIQESACSTAVLQLEHVIPRTWSLATCQECSEFQVSQSTSFWYQNPRTTGAWRALSGRSIDGQWGRCYKLKNPIGIILIMLRKGQESMAELPLLRCQRGCLDENDGRVLTATMSASSFSLYQMVVGKLISCDFGVIAYQAYLEIRSRLWRLLNWCLEPSIFNHLYDLPLGQQGGVVNNLQGKNQSQLRHTVRI